jgi:hypothetical protein
LDGYAPRRVNVPRPAGGAARGDQLRENRGEERDEALQSGYASGRHEMKQPDGRDHRARQDDRSRKKRAADPTQAKRRAAAFGKFHAEERYDGNESDRGRTTEIVAGPDARLVPVLRQAAVRECVADRRTEDAQGEDQFHERDRPDGSVFVFGE